MESTKARLMELIEVSGIDSAPAVAQQFEEFEIVVSEWDDKVKSIVVTDESQTDVMATARKGRLLLKGVRVGVDKTRKMLKARIVNDDLLPTDYRAGQRPSWTPLYEFGHIIVLVCPYILEV